MYSFLIVVAVRRICIMNMIINRQLRDNYIIRLIFRPFHTLKRKYEYVAYHKRVNTDYFKVIKNSKIGERCFIIGNGPSLTAEDLDLIKGEFSFAFNRIYNIYNKTNWRPTYYMVVDRSISTTLCKNKCFDLEAEKVFLLGKKVSQHLKGKNDVQEIINYGKQPLRLREYVPEMLSENVEDFFTPSSSVTIDAFELAFYMGFSEIYLLGVDNNFVIEIDKYGNKTINNSIQPHFKEDSESVIYPSCIDSLTQSFELCKRYADSHGVKVYNCTRGGKLEVFQRKQLEDVLKGK
jgi:hypothetical protein